MEEHIFGDTRLRIFPGSTIIQFVTSDFERLLDMRAIRNVSWRLGPLANGCVQFTSVFGCGRGMRTESVEYASAIVALLATRILPVDQRFVDVVHDDAPDHVYAWSWQIGTARIMSLALSMPLYTPKDYPSVSIAQNEWMDLTPA